MSEWIFIKDQIPPTNKNVLLLQKTGYSENTVIVVGSYIEKFTVESDEDYAEYCEEKNEYFAPEGFYESQFNWGEYADIGIGEEVIAWMPLPPKPEVK